MSLTLTSPGAGDLAQVVDALAAWQSDRHPLQLHPGDVGWFWRFGARATAHALRSWWSEGELVAVGLLDGPTVLRLAIAPHAERDEDVARQLAWDVASPDRGVLGAGEVSVESPTGALVHDALREGGWEVGEPWTPLRRDLTRPVEDPGVRVETVGAEQVHVRTALQRAAFETSTFTDESWHRMASGLPYPRARCLVGYDVDDTPAAVVTVWSAGRGRPGLLEPMGVHRDHRGRGLGRAITLAAAGALRDLGASSALVCTPTSNAGAVATYLSAGFVAEPLRYDCTRPS